ncbi:mucin-17-like [Branchiostoma floridae]|uniref:Mucin-17-like n=1 Tax=Branchiostoma floridae TaxID=7739 RepID=C3YT70_BRAFL|nr:mucin-17-like [Branchiostoma floridae]|eukprot:XP_002600425.1 hypothetical protein BRAFLDRAFT_99616 [Branchiostoma floridae]
MVRFRRRYSARRAKKPIERVTNFAGTRFYGACDYFTISEEGLDAYVRTKFVHCIYMPCVPKGSFLFVSDGRAIKLPKRVRRSVRWAWLRAVAWVCTIVAIIGVVVGVLPIEVRRGGPVAKASWPWALVGLSAVFLVLAICVTFYKPKASEQSQQEYREYLLHRDDDDDGREEVADAAEVHAGPADEVVTIEPHPHCPGPRKDNANVPMTGSPTSIPTPGNASSTSIATGYPNGTTISTDPMALLLESLRLETPVTLTTGNPSSTTLTIGNPSSTTLTNGNPSSTSIITANPSSTTVSTGNPSGPSLTTVYPNATFVANGYPMANDTVFTDWNPSGTMLTTWNPIDTTSPTTVHSNGRGLTEDTDSTGCPDGNPTSDNPNSMQDYGH